MKFFVGYQMFDGDSFTKELIARKEHISEVYFSWGDIPNGRNSRPMSVGMTQFEAQTKQLADLDRLAAAEMKFNLLLNATCYGRDSQSRAFFHKIGETVDFLHSRIGLASVTTTSPLIARFVRENFDGIDLRASVNMCIGTVEGMEYVKDYFDSFYVKRELNRDLSVIRGLRNWCDSNDKKLYALANSGCLNNCSAHTFHDNLVSHESEIAAMDNGYEFRGVCADFLTKQGNLSRILDVTGFIRPEDIHLYDGLFTSMKLATRVNSDPVRVLRAYIDNQKHIGSTLELLEPNHTAALYPYLLENNLITSEVTEGKLTYTNIEKALIKLEEDIYADK